MKMLVGCACRHLVLLRARCLQNSLAPQLWKRGHQVLRSFQSPTILQQGGSPWAPSLRRVQPRWLSGVDLSQRDPKPPSSSENSEKFAVIYRFPAIRLLKLFSRLKLLQTGFGLLILPPVWYFYGLNPLVTGLFSFTLVFLYALSFFLQRVIGIMYLNESRTVLKISHLTFWGKRRNFCCPVESLVTLGDEGKDRKRFLLKFRRGDQKKVLYFSLVLGQVVDHEAFGKVFGCYT
ncbi:transmembrane protein 186 isoform X2 [Ahaetulla prasina]|nr:transmembrane protein 186 isoform X2 [Ahaetulla prasina]XP_058013210.1 transmembrane protein 186 isoform X2 [Ahaetulla prasina]XP_058013211.1 transmembrane protein 186 isoform X2 [Ahaetulla prasina]XP_058013212.1 transmembrane protein 186 isoform X2 [Ahaetulla prasina]XP_058013213.1 transmembrane protein 186 isoform X2 [Ahaetulla prasina]